MSNNNKFYFLSPYGLGDTLLLCGFRNAWEKQHEGKIHFLIKASHQIVMDLYNITDYTIINLSSINLNKCAQKTPYPQKKSIYIAHPYYHSHLCDLMKLYEKTNMTLYDLYIEFLNLPLGTQLDLPSIEYIDYPLQNKYLSQIFTPEKCILIAPEANSLTMLNKKFWEHQVKKYKREGYTSLCMAINSKNIIRGSHAIQLSIKEAIILAQRCHKVLTMRSGFSDLLCALNIEQEVYYTSEKDYIHYSLKNLFPGSVNEFIVEHEVVLFKIFFLGFIPLLYVTQYKKNIYIKILKFFPVLKIKK